MSMVDNYAIFIGLAEEEPDGRIPAIDALNAIITPEQRGKGFIAVDQHSGGYKAFEARCLLFAGNYFPLSEMARAMLSVQWEGPDNVRLAHCGQEEGSFRMYSLSQLAELLRDSDTE